MMAARPLRAARRPRPLGRSLQPAARQEPAPRSGLSLAIPSGHAGAAHRIPGADGIARFELSEAVTGEHHYHLACTNCGAMEVILLPAEVEEGLARAAGELQRSGRFAADSHRVELTGRCAACTARRNWQDQPGQ